MTLLRSFCLFLALSWPAASFADLDAPIDLAQTLQWMAEALESEPSVTSLEIDAPGERLIIRFGDASEFTSFPHNLHQQLVTEDDPGLRQTLFDFHMGALIEHLSRGEVVYSEADLGRIYPVFRHHALGAEIQRQHEDVEIIVGEALGDAQIFYVLDSEKSVAYLTNHDLDTLGLTLQKLQEIARGNLELKQEELTVEGEGLFFLVLDGFYEASFVAYPPIWQSIDTQLDEIIMGFPNRDLVVFTDAAYDGAEEVLRNVVADMSKTGTYPVSELIYSWSGDRWVVIE